MTGIQCLSESLFFGLCKEVGTKKIVRMRRDIFDIKDMCQNNSFLGRCNGTRQMTSGSRREGFRFRSSDTDTMIWFTDDKVIRDLSHFENFSQPNKPLILMEYEHSPPGFALIQLLVPTHATNGRTKVKGHLWKSCVRINGRLYISNILFREILHVLSLPFTPKSAVHGPCISNFYGCCETDIAICFKCDFWPISTLPMIRRCQSWPNRLVLQDIFKSGCHLVAKGCPISSHEDEEWRISFSEAEQKLVYAMNHCQFLVYGLLKLFLKEVINHGVVDKLLCSYFMKTVVFWEITSNKIPLWCPQNMVLCFWSCFKHVMLWVYRGECPNFFIPHHNMFLGKMFGSAQQNLFQQLHGLYEQGYRCLLLSPSVRSCIVQVLYKPIIVINVTEEQYLTSVVDFDIELCCEVSCSYNFGNVSLRNCMQNLTTVEHLVTQIPLTQYQLLFLQKLTSNTLQSIAFHLHNRCRDRVRNKMMYISDRISCHMLKLAAKFGFVSDMLYIAMYYYKTCRYKEALSVIEMTKEMLSQPYVMYHYTVNKHRYTEAVGGWSWSTKMRQAIAWDIVLYNQIYCINELRVEEQISLINHCPSLSIPPHIILHLLSVLCYTYVDTVRRQQALDDLFVLLHHDNGAYIPLLLRDISYQILGICQEICGDRLNALRSFQESLRQYPIHEIGQATQIRIQHVLGQLQS